MAPFLQVQNLHHIYSMGTPFEHVALNDVSFSVERGEFIGIIGHTGSGKSTLMQHMNGLLKPTSGKILLDGKDIWTDKATTRQSRFRVGLVFQYPEYQLFEETVYKDIAFGPKNMGLDSAEVDRRVREAAGFVGITDAQLEVSPFDLSGGQKRRVALAGVIAMEPRLLILDEPAAGLDPRGRREILTGIKEYQRNTGNSVLIISHSMEDMAIYCDRVIVLSDGEQIMDGTCAEVFSRYEELYAVGLDVPEITKVAAALKRVGIDIGEDVYTVNWAMDRMKEKMNAGVTAHES